MIFCTNSTRLTRSGIQIFLNKTQGKYIFTLVGSAVQSRYICIWKPASLWSWINIHQPREGNQIIPIVWIRFICGRLFVLVRKWMCFLTFVCVLHILPHRTCSCVKGNYIDISFKLQTKERKSTALISFSLEFIVRHESWFHFIQSLAKLSLSPLVYWAEAL